MLGLIVALLNFLATLIAFLAEHGREEWWRWWQ
jgi:hypothetical protein